MFVAHASYNLSSFGIPRMISFSLAALRPRHVRRPSAAHSRFGGEVHARRKVWRARKLAHLTCGWSYSLRYLPARTIYLSARGTELYCFLTTVFVTTLCRARHKLKRARQLRPFLARFCMSGSHARRIALRESFCERYCTLLGVPIDFLLRLRAKQARRPSLRACFIFTVEVWVIAHLSA